MEFGDWLMDQINKQGYRSIKEFADAARIDRQTVWQWINKGTSPGIESCVQLADVLVLDWYYVVGMAYNLPLDNNHPIEARQITSMLDALSQEERNQVLEIVRTFYQRRENGSRQ